MVGVILDKFPNPLTQASSLVSGLEELNTEHVSETAWAGITFWNLIQNKLHKLVKYWPTLALVRNQKPCRIKISKSTSAGVMLYLLCLV